jgi:hypothetical protein
MLDELVAFGIVIGIAALADAGAFDSVTDMIDKAKRKAGL